MEGNGDAQLSYRLLVAVDIQGYSRRDAREQLRAQRELSDALDRAARGVGLDRARWHKQVGGDGELAVLPEGTDPAPVAGDFVILLDEALREANDGDAAGRFRLRVRLALHHGTLTAGPFGPAGDAPITVQRLLDATPLRRLLSGDTGRDLAYVVSDSLFEDVVRTGFCALPPHEFQAVKVAAKGATFRGHIHTGRAAGRAAGDAGARGGPASRPAPGAPGDARILTLPQLAAR
ncbi:hypothetical protein SAMN05443665_1004119 [Actinomadura meyerae]|uniref:Guanylate cyclase domain-containing protein n=1 Tax=Actinomadura meyerae TaxID=240840 RepID=A0A239EL21_9ACTN|nr:hypothetical protein [Actinomadura meyerae]SNS45470.1 hypothetical protein SAMN05443665_1004119 [Actinomadura meyerae]